MKLVGYRSVAPVTLAGDTIAFVRSLTIAELREVEAAAKELPEGDEQNLNAMKIMLAKCACDADGKAIFDGAADPAFDEIQIGVLARVLEVATEVNSQPGKA